MDSKGNFRFEKYNKLEQKPKQKMKTQNPQQKAQQQNGGGKESVTSKTEKWKVPNVNNRKKMNRALETHGSITKYLIFILLVSQKARRKRTGQKKYLKKSWLKTLHI